MSAPDSPEALGAMLYKAMRLGVPCYHCGAVPGVWCQTTGSRPAASLHHHRRDLAGVRTYTDALVAYVRQFPGWTVSAADGRELS